LLTIKELGLMFVYRSIHRFKLRQIYAILYLQYLHCLRAL
jgi:hypothetical protein